MSRRKKNRPARGRQSGPPPSRPRDPPAAERKPLEPNPPRPRKALLLVTGLLLAAWIAFLIILVIKTVS
jgi:hypothetical protein